MNNGDGEVQIIFKKIIIYTSIKDKYDINSRAFDIILTCKHIIA